MYKQYFKQRVYASVKMCNQKIKFIKAIHKNGPSSKSIKTPMKISNPYLMEAITAPK